MLPVAAVKLDSLTLPPAKALTAIPSLLVTLLDNDVRLDKSRVVPAPVASSVVYV